jgi:diacylglycerol kinase family enzyme
MFVINPFAGKGAWLGTLKNNIVAAAEAVGVTPEIYAEPGKERMEKHIRQLARSGEEIRFYACGGDGTIYSVVNASYGCKNVQIAAIPFGSGNDFIRLFGTKEGLQDVRRHIRGTPHWIDAIECDGEIAVNQCSMGLDAEVCAKQAAFKKIPWMSGEFAYTASLLYCVARRLKNTFTVQVDDHEPVTAPFLFALGGNARWYGGGYKGCPLALPDDGWLDCITVRRDFGLIKLLGLIGSYKKGEHLSWPYTSFVRGKKMRIQATKPAAVNVDGETRYVTESTFVLREKAICFVVPEGSLYLEQRANGTLSGEMDELA